MSRAICMLALTPMLTLPGCAAGPAPQVTVPEKTIQAWKKAGFEVRLEYFIPDVAGGRGVRLDLDSHKGKVRWAALPPSPLPVELGVTDTPVTDEDMKDIAAMPNLIDLSIADCGVTEAGIAALSGAKRLSRLALKGTGCATDKALEVIGRIKTLKYLNLISRSLQDDGLRHLKSLDLVLLSLDGSLTDSAVTHLVGFKSLKYLGIFNRKISAAGLATLKAALPDCKVDG
jgi:hypothetical protein